MASDGRVARWLYSNKNLAGCVLALGAPVLAVTGVVAPPIALALLPVLYAAGALAAPGRKPVDLVSGLDPDDVSRSLKTIRKTIKGKVNQAVSERVDRICTAIEQLLPRANELGTGSDEMHVLVKTATDYLPATLEPYLALPRMYAERKVLSDGKTASQILCDQLDVMAERLDAIGDAVARADGDKLLANGRFLSERFGHTGLQLPPDGGTGGAAPDGSGGPGTG
ncbi:MAG: hypothetical protein WCI74_12190, partial [Actinomycetes bacterium]